jgi:hypothetical protein
MNARRIIVAAIVLGIVGAAVLIVTRNQDSSPSAAPSDDSVLLADPAETYDPVRAGDPTPTGFRQLLSRDQIQPIYDPTFTTAEDVDWPDDMLVLGVAGVKAAKAYPVTHLNKHEMVNDTLEGEPILVSW